MVALVAAIDPEALRVLLNDGHLEQFPVSVFSLMFVVDFQRLYPWQFITLPNAALTIVIFLWLDSLRREAEAGREAFGSQPNLLIRMIRTRDFLVTLWLIIAFCYAVQYYYQTCSAPKWLENILSFLFGSVACGEV